MFSASASAYTAPHTAVRHPAIEGRLGQDVTSMDLLRAAVKPCMVCVPGKPSARQVRGTQVVRDVFLLTEAQTLVHDI